MTRSTLPSICRPHSMTRPTMAAAWRAKAVGEAAVREAAVVALRVISGKDFRFDPLSKEADRIKAQGAWRKWWEENSEDLLGG